MLTTRFETSPGYYSKTPAPPLNSKRITALRQKLARWWLSGYGPYPYGLTKCPTTSNICFAKIGTRVNNQSAFKPMDDIT